MTDFTSEQQALLNSLSGGSIPRPPTPEQRQTAAELENQYQAMGGLRRALAGLGLMASGVPLVRSTGLPQALSTSADMDIASRARPGLASFEQAYGHAAPFAIAGASLPSLFATLPRTALSTAAVEVPDAMATGESVPRAIQNSLLGAIPGPVLGRAITPRSPAEAFSSQWNNAISHLRNVRGLARDTSSSFPPWSPSAMSRHARTLPPEQHSAYVDTIRAGLAHTPMNRSLGSAYLNNQLLSPESQAILNALASGTVQAATDQ